MDLVVGQELPPYRLRARNLPVSKNPIHHDDVATGYGFTGGLVPGVTVYAYMTRPLVEAFGMAWLERGTASLRLPKPAYEGDDITVSAKVAGIDERGVTVDVAAVNQAGVECGVVSAGLPTVREAELPDPSTYPEAPLPSDPPPASAELFRSALRLGSIRSEFRADEAAWYLEDVSEELPIYREEAVAHPAYLLQLANDVLSHNVRLGPWMHVSSEVAHFRAVRDGDAMSVRGRVADAFERKGHKFVELSVLVLANGTAPALHVRHVAIYEPRSPGA